MNKHHFNNTCFIHNCELKEAYVFIHYGLIRYSDQYLQDRITLFPNSNFYVNGGYILSNEHFIQKTTYCEECRNVHEQWCQTHQNRDGLALDHEAYDFCIRYQIELSSSIIINTTGINQPL